jgi:hypothetical protein
MTRATVVAALFFTALLMTSAACIPEQGPMMEPGSDCMECHGGGGGEESGRTWTIAGTWDRQGQQVTIVDAAGKSFSLHTNQAGNFWSSEPVAFPLRVGVDGQAMRDPANHGSCNASGCHPGKGSGGGD